MALSIVTDLMKFCKNHYNRKRGRAQGRNPGKQQNPSTTPGNTADSQDLGKGLSEPSPQVSLVGKVVRRSTSSLNDDNHAPSITKPPKLAEVSAYKPVMEPSPPSRRATGSESLNHVSGSRMSIASIAREPLSHLHSKSHRPHTPHISERRHSDTSARQIYYDQGEERDRVIPKGILCYLNVMCNGENLSKGKPFEKLDWQDDASYGTVNDAANEWLKTSPETIDKSVWRTDGVCKLFKKKQECASKALETEDQWSEVLHLIIAEFVTIPGNEYAKFHLEITWTYAAVDVSATDKKYSTEIADRIDSRIRINWRGKKFIPQKDLHAIMSLSVIEKLINNDKSLANTEDAGAVDRWILDKQTFIDDVASSHKHLIALCVHEGLPLKCLWQMLYLGQKPACFPLQASDKPPAAKKIRFDNLIHKQFIFIAYQFPKPTDAKVHCIDQSDLTENHVLPIESCDKTNPIGSGAFKNVYEVQIQPGHHRFTAV